MKLVCELFNSEIVFAENVVNTLVIEKPRLYNQFLSNLIRQLDGETGPIILSDDSVEKKISASIDLIDHYFPFDINNKKMLTKIINILEKEATNEIYYNQTMKLLADIEVFMDDVSEILPCKLVYENLSPVGLIKIASPKIYNDAVSVLESIFNYMNLVNELDKEKVFIFVNMRSFFEDDEVQEFIDTVIAHKYHILMLENFPKEKLKNENRIIIDCDLCEI